MKTRKSWAWPVLLASFSFLLQMSTRATAQDDQQGDQDPPGRVARLNSADGSVSFRPGGEDDWVTAVPNRPLVTGDDLIAEGHAPGPRFREILNAVEDAQLEGRLSSRDVALEFVRREFPV